MGMNIMYVRPYPGEMNLVKDKLSAHEIYEVNDVWDLPEDMRSTISVLSIFVDYKITKDVLDALPACQLVATRSAGFDHIDINEARARNITIMRVPHYGTRTVAEYVFALMFALSRNAYQAYIDLQKNSSSINMPLYEGFDLASKTLGVIGTGAIGKNVCQIGTGIGMKVLAYDTYQDEAFAKSTGVVYTSFEDLLKNADVVTLHVPALPETHHLMNKTAFDLMKPGSYLINTARGEIIDTDALVTALQTQKLAGAALDVLESEHDLYNEEHLLSHNTDHTELWRQIVANHILIDRPNVIVTPHIAFNTKEAKKEITEITISNINNWIAGATSNTI